MDEAHETTSEAQMWKAKYDRLLLNFENVQMINQQLEDRLLTVVEKTESDKLCLSQEIDELNAKVQADQQKYGSLEAEKGTNKNNPSYAKHQNPLMRKANSETHGPGAIAPMMQISSFPPTAMVFHQSESLDEIESNTQTHGDNEIVGTDSHRPQSPIAAPPADPEPTDATKDSHFYTLERILMSKEYSDHVTSTWLAKCPKCDHSGDLVSKQSQTNGTPLKLNTYQNNKSQPQLLLNKSSGSLAQTLFDNKFQTFASNSSKNDGGNKDTNRSSSADINTDSAIWFGSAVHGAGRGEPGSTPTSGKIETL